MIDITNISLQQSFANGFQGYVPEPTILPGHGGPITSSELNINDVLSGRGNKINHHPGNVHFRDVVTQCKSKYCDPTNKKIEKAFLAAKTVAIVRCLDPPGRFLQKNEKTGLWLEIGDDRARKKAAQALREDAAEVRAERKHPLKVESPTETPQPQFVTPTSTPIRQQMVENESEQSNSNNHPNSTTPPPPYLCNYSSLSTIEMSTCSDFVSIPDPTTFFRNDTLSSQVSMLSDVSSKLMQLERDHTRSLLQKLHHDCEKIHPVEPMVRPYDKNGYYRFSLTDQDMRSVGDISCSDLLSDANFEIEIPGVSDDTFVNFPDEPEGRCPKALEVRSRHGRRQVNNASCWNRSSFPLAKNECMIPTVSFSFDSTMDDDIPVDYSSNNKSHASEVGLLFNTGPHRKHSDNSEAMIATMANLTRNCSQSSGMLSLMTNLHRFLSDSNAAAAIY